MVPKDYVGNLKFRKKILRWGQKSEDNARVLRGICRQDFLFYVNTFVWTYDPRNVFAPSVPFISYPFQDRAFRELLGAIGDHDTLTEKSRDMGASWMFLIAFEWLWHFSKLPLAFMCISRKEDLVDRTGDPDCLFWKIDFILDHQPRWLKPNYGRKLLQFLNEDTGSAIDGDSTTGDVGRGGRRTAIALDEFAAVDEGKEVLKATADNTNCRIFNSTPKGIGNEFYNMRQSCEHIITLHWSEHPKKAVGLYRADDDGIEYLDNDYWLDLPKEKYDQYEFIRDGKLRSPWYDAECRRRGNPQEIAQELDIDYLASDYQFFDPAKLKAVTIRDVREPYHRGNLVFDKEGFQKIEFVESPHGILKLWIGLDNRGEPPSDRPYFAGSDIAAGSKDMSGRGASNSVTSVGDGRAMEKVAELTTHGMDPIEFALYTIALCKWFRGNKDLGAYLAWEANGPSGGLFGQTIIEQGYRNIYYRESLDKISAIPTQTPGWWSTPKTKPVLLGAYRGALGNPFINRCSDALEECKSYVMQLNGSVVHRSSTSTDDPNAARESHGDRVIADALLWWIMKDGIVLKEERAAVPDNCYARRSERRHRKIAEAVEGYW